MEERVMVKALFKDEDMKPIALTKDGIIHDVNAVAVISELVRILGKDSIENIIQDVV
jgi:hypothetical protein